METSDIHGFAELPWDHLALPDRLWKDLTQLPNGCWAAPSRYKARGFQNTVVTRVARRSAYEAMAITPTCADLRCCNPAHLCVVWRTPVTEESLGHDSP